ncbi:homoserine kinase [Actomonas aquatica]|uniref:Homoserine kinase n=1 Tax=Actomonas aquatica TaxID=2866162 RepID=A0ABZ1CAV8_9BACT|nr:homoserine kinase [Opitutus sp. WL0086]WRQ88638.1 homoserine kinase [Opitutus sp. WL0086]
MSPVTVRVPGSTSNCGAGFDTLGLALQIYNRVTLTPDVSLPAGTAKGERASDERANGLVNEALAAWRERVAAAAELPGFRFRIEGDVPPARGLGSSVTVIAGILGGVNHWAGEALTREELAALITRLEGHPDNATAGVLGGFCVARCAPTPADYQGLVRIELEDTLRFVVVSPVTEVATKASRGVLPQEISHLDAVRSVNSAAYLTAALATKNYESLRGAVGDFLHEPYRLPGIVGAAEAIAAGVKAGALCGWLSGSGSSVLCVGLVDTAAAVGDAMRSAFAAKGIDSAINVLSADNHGLVVE